MVVGIIVNVDLLSVFFFKTETNFLFAKIYKELRAQSKANNGTGQNGNGSGSATLCGSNVGASSDDDALKCSGGVRDWSRGQEVRISEIEKSADGIRIGTF